MFPQGPLVYCSMNQGATLSFLFLLVQVEDLSASCANTLPPWLSLFARWTPGFFFGGVGWGGKRFGVPFSKASSETIKVLDIFKWQLHIIPGKSRNTELCFFVFPLTIKADHESTWIKGCIINETIWWHEEPKLEMVSRSLKQCGIFR